MNEILAANLQYLSKNQVLVYAKVMSVLEDTVQAYFCIEETRNGMFNIKSVNNNRYLYSVYDPMHEATRWCDSLEYDTDANRSVIMCGLGLTYHLGVFMERYTAAKIFIVEPSVEIFIEMLKIIDISTLYGHPNIISIAVGIDQDMHIEFMKSISMYSAFPFQYISIPYMKWLNQTYEQQLMHDLKEIQIRKKAIQGFRETFGTQMFINSFRNLPLLLKTPSIRSLANKFRNSTVIVVGGGPSLQDDIEYIKNMANDWIIIAAGSSVQSLMHYNIQPHLIVSMDPGKYNGNIFENNDFSHIPLLWMPQIYNTIPNLHPHNNYVGYYFNDAIVNYFVEYQTEEYVFTPTYSVTGTAIQIGAYLGASRIILAGQDLSYPGEQMYSPGAAHVEPQQNDRIRKELTYAVSNVQGGNNPTTFSMLQTLNDIGRLIVNLQGINFINTSSCGAVIEGTTYRPMKEVILQESIQNLYPTNCLSPQYHEQVFTTADIESIINKAQIGLEYLNALEGNITELKSIIICLDNATLKTTEMITLMQKVELILGNITSHSIYNNVLSSWLSIEIAEFERRSIEIFKAQQINQKRDLIIDIIGKLTIDIKRFLPQLVTEFSVLYESLTESRSVLKDK